MIRPNTFRSVAVVKNPEAFRDKAIMKLIRELARPIMFPCIGITTVPMSAASTYPKPTRAEFWAMDGNRAILVDLVPEVINRNVQATIMPRYESSLCSVMRRLWQWCTTTTSAVNRICRTLRAIMPMNEPIPFITTKLMFDWITTTTGAQRGLLYGRMFLHGVTPKQLFCAVLRAVDAAPGLSCSLIVA